jgi:hypothetical protein
VEYDDFCSKGERYALVRRLLLAELLLKMIHPIFSEENSERVLFIWILYISLHLIEFL